MRVRARARGLAAAAIRRRAAAMLRASDVADRELSVLLCGVRQMEMLHRAYAHVEGATDVLAFPQVRGPLLGDVVLCVPVLRRQARGSGRTLLAEATRALAHGVLHLLGHDHGVPRARQRMDAALEVLVAAASRAGGPVRSPAEKGALERHARR